MVIALIVSLEARTELFFSELPVHYRVLAYLTGTFLFKYTVLTAHENAARLPGDPWLCMRISYRSSKTANCPAPCVVFCDVVGS